MKKKPLALQTTFIYCAALAVALLPLVSPQARAGNDRSDNSTTLPYKYLYFNAVDGGANAVSGKITTKIAGDPIKLDIYAISTRKDGVQTDFSRPVLVDLWGSQTPAPAPSRTCPPSGFTLLMTSPVPVLLSRGVGRVILPAVKDVWRNVYVRISYPDGKDNWGHWNNWGHWGTSTTSCSSDNFAIRPYRFNINASDSDWQSAGTTRTLANTDAKDGYVHKAGRPFTITATAVNAAGSITGNYNGSPTVSSLACTLPSSCVDGTLSLGTWNGSGMVTTNTASYSEVGALSLKLVDSSFASVDANDGSTAQQRDITSTPPGSAATDVGRFVPDHFVLTPANTPQFQTFGAAGNGRSFTYIGQPFGYATAPQATVTAENAAGGTTQNYRGSLWKLTAANVTQAYSPLASASPGLDTGLIGTPTITSNGNGTGTISPNVNDQLAFVRNLKTPHAPFDADITLAMSVKDSSEAGTSGNGTITTTSPALFDGSGSGIAFDSGNRFRYGRLKLGNAYGSVQLALPIPIETQYWNGTAFVANRADNSTIIPAPAVTLGNFQGNLKSGETAATIGGPFVAGQGNLSLSKPSGGDGQYNGSVDVSVDLGATGADLPWLLGNWTGAAYDQSPPAARAVFGIYKHGSDTNGLIYLRENYN